MSNKIGTRTAFPYTTFYKGESKLLQYFGNVRFNLIALHTFVMVVKEINHTGWWDAKAC